MTGRRSRRKGADFERHVAHWLRSAGFADAKRGLQSQSGSAAPDVDGTPWWIECKVGAEPPIWRAMAQAEADTDGRPPVVVARRNRRVENGREVRPVTTVVVMRLADWIPMAEAASRYEAIRTIDDATTAARMRARGVEPPETLEDAVQVAQDAVKRLRLLVADMERDARRLAERSGLDYAAIRTAAASRKEH